MKLHFLVKIDLKNVCACALARACEEDGDVNKELHSQFISVFSLNGSLM